MSLAWQVTEDDALVVVRAHHPTITIEDPLLARVLQLAAKHEGRILAAVLCGNDLDQQAAYGNQELEAVLLEEGLLHGPPRLTV